MPRIPRNQTDIHIGARLRRRRKELRLSQAQLGDTVGVTYQQVQKYESGANSISCSALFLFAKALQTDVTWFLQDSLDKPVNSEPVALSEIDRLFSSIPKRAARKQLLAFIRTLAGEN